MKLDYKILWLDDKMDVILDGEYDREIKSFLYNEGFNPIIITVKNEKEFFNNLDDTYDLIMTDYHLNEKEGTTRDGDIIIKEVREKNSIFTEIMFYSAQGEVVDTVKLDRITFVDTRKIIGNDHYDKLIGKALNLIQLTIKKFQHIVAMRGMIMNETSTLDMQMLDIIKKSLSHDKVNFDELAPSIYDELKQLYNSKIKFVDKCRDSGKFKSLSKDNFVFSAEYKIKTLGQILTSLKLEDFSGEYKEEINSIRNKFAHALLFKDKNGREYFKHGESGLTFDEELCRKIRLDIAKHKNNFEKLKSALD